MDINDNRESDLTKWIITNMYHQQPNVPPSTFNPSENDAIIRQFNLPTHNIMVGGMIYIPEDKYFYFLRKYAECILEKKYSFFFSENADPRAFRYFLDIDYKIKIPQDISEKTPDEVLKWSNLNLNNFVKNHLKNVRDCCHITISQFYNKVENPRPQTKKSVVPKSFNCDHIADMIICTTDFSSTKKYCKFGVHIYFPNVIINNIRALVLTNHIIQLLNEKSPLDFDMDWHDVMDWNIYKNPKLRILYSNKLKKNDSIYIPKLFIDGKNNRIDSEKTKKLNQSTFEMILYTSLSYDCNTDCFFNQMTEPYDETQKQKITNTHMNLMIENLLYNSSKTFCLQFNDNSHGKHKADWLSHKVSQSKKKKSCVSDENQLRAIFYCILLYGKRNFSTFVRSSATSPYSVKAKKTNIVSLNDEKHLLLIHPKNGVQTKQKINFDSNYGDCIISNCFFDHDQQTITASIYSSNSNNDRFCYNKGGIHISAQIYFVFSKKKKTYRQDCFSSHCNKTGYIDKEIPKVCYEILFS